MIEFFDCDAGFGRAMVPPMRYAATADELLEEMDFCGIGEALVYHAAMRWVAAGKLDTESLITHVASPDEAPEIFKMIEQNEEQFLGIVFDWQAQ